MAKTTSELIRELERRNMLLSAAAALLPQSVWHLVWYRGIGPLSEKDITDSLNNSGTFFPVGNPIVAGLAVGHTVKVRAAPLERTIGIAVQHLSGAPGLAQAKLTLKYVVPANIGTTGDELGKLDQVVAVAAQAPQFQRDPLRIVSTVTAVTDTVKQAAGGIVGGLKTGLSIGIAGALLLGTWLLIGRRS